MFFPSRLKIGDLSYSKRSHFDFFKKRGYDTALYGKPVDPEFCNLKEYQDLLVFAFIEAFVPPGSTILDVGGGDSRILRHFGKTHDCWNLDKLEGIGNGLQEIESGPFHLVRDYIGNFNPELPDKHFDFVFSLSALEHVPEGDPSLFSTLLADLQRVSKPGAYSLHLFDVTLGPPACWTNLFLPYLVAYTPALTSFTPLPNLAEDADLFVMSKAFYQHGWEATTGVPYEKFGRPASCQVIWRAE
jgi:hypothetical protein